jgi:hypothetical protein
MCARGTDSHSAIFLFLFYLMTIPTVWYNIYIDGKNGGMFWVSDDVIGFIDAYKSY